VTALLAASSTGTKLVVVLLIALATLTLVWAVAIAFGRRQARIERRLAGYEVDAAARGARTGQPVVMSAETRVVQRAVGITSRLADRAGVLTKTEVLLEQADVPLRPAELLFYVAVFALLVFLITLLLLSNLLIALIAAVMVAVVPFAVIAYQRDARRRAFEGMLPDTLQLLAGSLRAGFSFIQGLETVANETTDPMRRELQRVFTEARLGRPIEDALGDVAEKMSSQDLGWAVMAIRIQREVGGNLAQLLDTVADTMVKRERLRREIRTLTAEGRFSAVVVSAFPFLFGLFLWVTQPEYMNRLFDETLGIFAVGLAALLTVVGWFWMRRIVDIEV
jgi:tight adherence protein B